MRLSTLVAGSVAAAATTFAAQQIDFAAVPPCGVPCLIKVAPTLGCELLDFDCLCRHGHQLASGMTPCLLTNCTMTDTVEMSKLAAQVCETPHVTKQPLLWSVLIACIALSYSIYFLRILSRLWIAKKMWLDDWVLSFALIPTLGAEILVSLAIKSGLGLHLFEVLPQNVERQLGLFLGVEAFYILIVMNVKISIVCFFLRTFPDRQFRLVCKAFIALIAANGVMFIFLVVFQCRPVSFAWHKTGMNGTCLNLNSVAYAGAGTAALQDFIALILPINQLRKLHLDMEKKIGVGFMMAIGSLGCVASLIRLKSLSEFGNNISVTPDPSWSNANTTMWSMIEVSTMISCACLPALRPLALRLGREIGAFFRRPVFEPMRRTVDNVTDQVGSSQVGASIIALKTALSVSPKSISGRKSGRSGGGSLRQNKQQSFGDRFRFGTEFAIPTGSNESKDRRESKSVGTTSTVTRVGDIEISPIVGNYAARSIDVESNGVAEGAGDASMEGIETQGIFVARGFRTYSTRLRDSTSVERDATKGYNGV